MPTDTQIKDRSLSLIEIHLGSTTAQMYRDFYKEKPADVVLSSAKELLIEVIGELKAEKEIKETILFD